MRILAIETSCDETSVSVLKKNGSAIIALSNVISSSADIHATTGGIIPEQAAREQVKLILPVLLSALQKANLCDETSFESGRKAVDEYIDAIAVTYGPGLIGSLLVGVETAKTLSWVFGKPLVPISHLLAHIYANFIREDIREITFPAIGLIVSGGHTDLLLFSSINKYRWIGGTRDDAAGEAFDKIGRLLQLPYPAGPVIEQRALNVTSTDLVFSKPLLHSKDYDFSFSGLKTEVNRYVQNHPNMSTDEINHVCFAVQQSITEVLVKKTLRAAQEFGATSIMLGGGVSANKALRNQLQLKVEQLKSNINLYYPSLEYCTDNAAMIGATALLNYHPVDWRTIKAQPELYFA